MVHPYVEKESIGAAYQKALDVALGHPSHLTIHISEPVASVSDVPESDSFDDWEDVLNLGPIYESYRDFVFSEDDSASSGGCSDSQNGCPSGRTGKDWIDTRIDEQFCGKFNAQSHDALQQVKERLKQGGQPGSWSNALVVQVYQSEDLDKATSSFYAGSSCLTQMQFKIEHNKLNLFATFRSQYFDTKAYGNLIALAMLLARVCQETGYEPGYLVETANNAILDDEGTAKELRDEMLSAPAALDD
jgi:hypothetical protein